MIPRRRSAARSDSTGSAVLGFWGLRVRVRGEESDIPFESGRRTRTPFRPDKDPDVSFALVVRVFFAVFVLVLTQ